MPQDRRSYAEKCKDPKWQKRRLEILNRDEFTCQGCFDSTSTLHVHHRWYIEGADPWEYPAEALITLCENCHENESNALPLATRDLVQTLKKAGAMATNFNDLSFFIGQVVNAHGTLKGPPDSWIVLAHGIRELMYANASGAQLWVDLRDRWGVVHREYLAWLANENKK